MLVACLIGGGPLMVPASACTRIGGVRIGCSSNTSSPSSTRKPSPSTTLMRLLNREREAQGLGKLTLDAAATRMAREHARGMARRGRIYHNPQLRTAAGRRRLGDPWMSGENVGVGPSARSVHKAFMKSRDHRANILRPGFRKLGVGVYDDGEDLWVVEVFLTSRTNSSIANRRPHQTVPPAIGTIAAAPVIAARADPRRGSPVLIAELESDTPLLSGVARDPDATVAAAASAGTVPVVTPILLLIGMTLLATQALAHGRRRRRPAEVHRV